MKKKLLGPISLIMLLAGVAVGPSLQADTLRLKNGQWVEGTYLGGNSRSIRFSISGSTRTYSVADIDQLQFTGFSPVAGSRFVPFENSLLRMNRPDNWQVAQDGTSWTIAPSGGKVRDRNGNMSLA